MIIGMNRLMAAKGFPFATGHQVADHLIHVHVRLGATPRLPDLEGKLIVMLSLNNGICRGDDLVGDLLVKHPMTSIHGCTALFNQGQCMDQFNGNSLIADRKIAERSFRLSTPKGFVTDFDRTKAVMLDAERSGHWGFPGCS